MPPDATSSAQRPRHPAPSPPASRRPDRLVRLSLGTFLRAHREHLTCEQAGLAPRPAGQRRRTPGLTRSEVAFRAGVGLAWYSALEQGRARPSRDVLGAVCRALQMDAHSRAHAMELGGFRAVALVGDPSEIVSQVGPMLHAWPMTPALLVDHNLDVLAWNVAPGAVWGDPARTPARRRNLLLLVLDPATRERTPQWQDLAWMLRGTLRASHHRRREDPRVAEIYALLNHLHPDLAHWWACQSVAVLQPCRLMLHADRTDDRPAEAIVSAARPVQDVAATIVVQHPPAA